MAAIPKASCATCRDITSKIELEISRKSYHVARALRKFDSRRPKEYPTTGKVTLSYGKYGPTQEVELPLEKVPQHILFPTYTNVAQDPEGVLSSITLGAEASLGQADNEAKLQKIAAQHGAMSVTFESNSIRMGSFEPFLWKITHCLLWMFNRELAQASITSNYVRGLIDPLVKPGDGSLLARNIYSRSDVPTHHALAGATVFTREEEKHGYLHFEIEFLRGAGLPAYYCMVANPKQLAVGPKRLL